MWQTETYYFKHALLAHLGTVVIEIRRCMSESEFSMAPRTSAIWPLHVQLHCVSATGQRRLF